jgi:hypothetical protein
MANYMEIITANYPGIIITCIGDPTIYENITLVEGVAIPPKADLDALDFQRIISLQIAAMSQACQQQIISGFTCDVFGNGPYEYDSEDVDQINLLGSVAIAQPTPSNPAGMSVQYAARRYIDGVPEQPKQYYLHTYEQIRGVMVNGGLWKLGLLLKFNTKRVYLLACTDEATALAVTWDSVEPT